VNSICKLLLRTEEIFHKSGKAELRIEGHGITELLVEFCELKSNSDFGGLRGDILAYEVQHNSICFYS